MIQTRLELTVPMPLSLLLGDQVVRAGAQEVMLSSHHCRRYHEKAEQELLPTFKPNKKPTDKGAWEFEKYNMQVLIPSGIEETIEE